MRILYLSPVPLSEQNDGVKIRGASLLHALSQRAEVVVLSFRDNGKGDVSLPTRPGPLERLLSLEPSLFRCFRSEEYRKRLKEMAHQFDACFCLGLQMTQYLKDLPPGMPVILDNFNVESDILMGLAARRHGIRRLYWLWQGWKLRRYEKRALRSVQLALTISTQDHRRFLDMVPDAKVYCVAPGLNLRPYLEAEGAPKAGTLVFVGALDWHVNIDAARWMTYEVFPLIRTRMANAQLLLVGRRPAASVRELANQPGVTLLSDVPSVMPFLSESQVVVVPLRFGSGVQTKVIEAMAAGRPVVTTSVGYEGLQAEAGRDLLVADGEREFADSCLTLLQDAERAQCVGATGRTAVRERYSLERLCRDVAKALDSVLHSAGG